MINPKIYLAIDNCFAYKRWTKPESWAKIISDMGIKYVEASSDTELDPLYMGKEYLERWVQDVRKAERTYGVKIANLYSGHGTYSTLGLTHTDSSVRERMVEKWFKPLLQIAKDVDAGVGFYAHGFDNSVLQDTEEYKKYYEILLQQLAEINCFAKKIDCQKVGLEQMYAPNLIPWTINGAISLMAEIKKRSDRDFYITEDVGHHHIKFMRPSKEKIKKAFVENDQEIWLGSDKAYDLFDGAKKHGSLNDCDLNTIMDNMDANEHLFVSNEDTDCYTWLKKIGCYCPIIHLQQTNGLSSTHNAFTQLNNKNGIIDGKKLLLALQESYNTIQDEQMPKQCDKIYLTMELFSKTTQTNYAILNEYRETVDYWRTFIPEDGMHLDELLLDSI